MAAAKKFAGVGGCLLCLIVTCCFVRAIQIRSSLGGGGEPDSPSIVLPRTNWDFGAVESNRNYRARFEIGNDGASRLVLRQREMSCDCLSTGVLPTMIAAGETAQIEVELNTAGMSGAVVQEASYASNDPKSPGFVLRLTANVMTGTPADFVIAPAAQPSRLNQTADNRATSSQSNSILRRPAEARD